MTLGLLALMVSLPFLLPLHTDPLVSFWSEWWAGILGLMAVASGFLALRDRPLILPVTLGIPAVLLLALLFQFVLGRLNFPQNGLLAASCLIWAGLLMILGRNLADIAALPRLADVLASAIALSALAGTGIALFQWLGLHSEWPWLFHGPAGTVTANLGQANHHAHHIWLGIVSVFYLRSRGWLPRSLLWLVLLPMALGSILSGSRSTFLYPVLLLVVVARARYDTPDGPASKLLYDATLLLPVVVALNIFSAWASPHLPDFLAIFGLTTTAGHPFASPMDRLFGSGGGRFAIARVAWLAFLEHPWIGQGVGNYYASSFRITAGNNANGDLLAGENAHNLVLHLMAEFGAPATVVVVLLLILWGRRFIGQTWGLAQMWCAAILGVGAIHAMLEYPLRYTYFLGPAALLLGATAPGKSFALAGRRLAIYVFLITLGGAMILVNLRKDYADIESILSQPFAGHPDRERAWQASMNRLLTLNHDSLLSPWALLTFVKLSGVTPQQAQERATLCEQGLRLIPHRSYVVGCAMQLAVAGRNEDAIILTQAALNAYPSEQQETVNELAKGAYAFREITSLWQLSQKQIAGGTVSRDWR